MGEIRVGTASWTDKALLPPELALQGPPPGRPQGHASSVPPVITATTDLAVVRFHGHSEKRTSKDIYERFGYLYSEREMADWAPKVRALADQAGETHVLFNNCYSSYAQTNAAQLSALLTS